MPNFVVSICGIGTVATASAFQADITVGSSPTYRSMSNKMSNKKHFEKLQRDALEEVDALNEEYNKTARQLDKLEQNAKVKEYIELKYKWNNELQELASAKQRLGTWTLALSKL